MKKIFVRISPDGSQTTIDVKDDGPPSCCQPEDVAIRAKAESIGGLKFERESIYCDLIGGRERREDLCPIEPLPDRKGGT